VLIAVLNQSTRVSDDEAAEMTQAVAYQLRYHTAPAWDRNPGAVVFYKDAASVPVDAHGVTLVDAIPNEPAGVLGYHTENSKGIWGIVAASPSLDAGASVLTGDWSVSSILSHEVQEMFGDPNCNLWGASGRYDYCVELCDPVEAPTYAVNGVSVSNFLLPAWFDAQGKGPFDYLGLLKKPFSLLKGGYMVYATEERDRQKFGDNFPEWRREMKQAEYTRTQRRIRQTGEVE
jgi:hypothetical protein